LPLRGRALYTFCPKERQRVENATGFDFAAPRQGALYVLSQRALLG
jgi:hypothetical protein